MLFTLDQSTIERNSYASLMKSIVHIIYKGLFTIMLRLDAWYRDPKPSNLTVLALDYL